MTDGAESTCVVELIERCYASRKQMSLAWLDCLTTSRTEV